jgi:hypothetical protein
MPEDKPPQTPFGIEMERRRRQAGLSQAKAALVCGVGRSRWGQVEQGYESLGKDTGGVEHFKEAPPSRTFVISVAKGLGWDRAEALQLAGYDPEPEPTDEPLKLPPSGLMENWSRLTRTQQRALEWIIRLMLDPHASGDFADTGSDQRPVFSDRPGDGTRSRI